LAFGFRVLSGRDLSRPQNLWIPAFAGMTEEKAGMTEEKAGMTEEKTGMTTLVGLVWGLVWGFGGLVFGFRVLFGRDLSRPNNLWIPALE